MSKREFINPVFDNFQMLSPKQVTLACYLKMYRRKYNISQKEAARIFTKYGQPHDVRFAQTEIAKYETYKTIPKPNKLNVLMNALDIDPSWL